MNSSIDWTSPEAYAGRMIPVRRRRSGLLTFAAQMRIAFRRYRREQIRLARHAQLQVALRDLSDHLRRDIGLL